MTVEDGLLAAFDAGAKSVVAAPQPDNEQKLRVIVQWLEKNQPDVFKRGLWDAIELAGAAALPSPDSPEEEILGRAVWKADQEWNDLTKHDKLAPSADWGEWIASHVVSALGELKEPK